ncbi:sensor histidine kinase [Fibrella aquatica]|uniref:sensor histidine kinase n=1 Tax=Fibrella aquatica TaxID=3242487 RepID=UPI0035203D58
MLIWIKSLVNRIPRPVQRIWLAYNVWIILVLSVVGLWLLNGEWLINSYLDPTAGFRKLDEGGSFRAGAFVGFIVGRLVWHPFVTLAWLGLFWSVAALHYRYLFNRLKKVTWQKLVLYAILLWASKDVVADLLTFWLHDEHRASYGLANTFMISNILYTFWSYFRDSRKARQQLTEQTTQAELAALKAQINPHFLFNSLNNIFGTALTEGGQRTPDGVQQLSRLMRYQLEKTQTERVDIDLELRFLDEYVQFHRQLMPDPYALTHDFDWDEQPIQMAPLLLTPLVDYALQHRQAGKNVPIHSRLSVQKQVLHYQLTYPANPTVNVDHELNNVDQRLTTLYPGLYTLKSLEHDQLNTLSLTINLT